MMHDSQTSLRAIILAAGRGSRMGELTADCPKCMTPFAGRRLLDWQLDALRGAGIGLDSIAVVRGYQKPLFDQESLRCFDNERWAQTNMVRSLACAADWLRAGPCIVSYADIFYPAATVASLAAADGELAIAYDPDWRALWEARFADPRADAESFVRDATGALVEIGARVADLDVVQGQYMGLLRWTPASWARAEAILASMADELADRLDMTSLLQRLLHAGERIETRATRGPWGEVDCESDLRAYESMMADGRMAWPPPEHGVTSSTANLGSSRASA